MTRVEVGVNWGARFRLVIVMEAARHQEEIKDGTTPAETARRPAEGDLVQ